MFRSQRVQPSRQAVAVEAAGLFEERPYHA
jgi:hypothetical protein